MDHKGESDFPTLRLEDNLGPTIQIQHGCHSTSSCTQRTSVISPPNYLRADEDPKPHTVTPSSHLAKLRCSDLGKRRGVVGFLRGNKQVAFGGAGSSQKGCHSLFLRYKRMVLARAEKRPQREGRAGNLPNGSEDCETI